MDFKSIPVRQIILRGVDSTMKLPVIVRLLGYFEQ
jgi:hypothetical protein